MSGEKPGIRWEDCLALQWSLWRSGAVPYDEARHSECPPYPVQQVSRAAFNRQKYAAITTGCISRASCRFYKEMSGFWYNWGFYDSVCSVRSTFLSLSEDTLGRLLDVFSAVVFMCGGLNDQRLVGLGAKARSNLSEPECDPLHSHTVSGGQQNGRLC